MRYSRAAAATMAAVLIAGCGAATATSARTGAPASAKPGRPTEQARPSPAPSPSPTPPPPPPAAAISSYSAPDGSVITLATFPAGSRFRLHGGSQDPGYPALAGLQGGPVIGPAEHSALIAAFNGGFKLSAGAGGYEQEGHVVSPLVPGLASLVIDRSGAATVGVWGHGLPRPGEGVESVRQNLPPLVSQGQVAASAANWPAWGATLGGGELVARSALGANRAGQLIYAGSMSASPAALAEALVHAGAWYAMELDINPEWVQLDVARKPGHRLRAAIPGQVRPPDQYLAGWVRDFITVLAGS